MKIKEYSIEKVAIKDIKNLPFNRAIKMTQVDNLLNSMSNYGILRFPVLIKTKLNTHKVSYYNLDGQHLVAGLIKADIPTTKAIVIETEDQTMIVNIMATLNNCNMRWTLDNYVDAYCSLCNKFYETLKSHKMATGLNYAVSALILGESDHKSLKNGSFKVTSRDYDVVTANLIDVVSFLGTSNSKFMKSFIKFRRSPGIDYNHKKFMQKLAQNKSKVKLVHDESAMRKVLEDLYK